MTAPRNKYAWLEGLWLLDLSGERLRVLGAIQSAHRDGASLISTAEIVKRTGLSRSAASRNLKAAERQKLVAVEWSRGGSRPHRITLLDPSTAVLNCGSHGAAVERDADCGSHEAAVTAAVTRARVGSTLDLVGGPPAGPPLPDPVSTSNVGHEGPSSSPPMPPEGGVGDDADPIDAMGKPSSTVAPSASTIEERILKLDQEIDALRNFDTGDYPALPLSVRVFMKRAFYGEDDLDGDTLDEVERDLAAFQAGIWCDGSDEDEDEDDLGTWDRADADEDDEANSLIAAAPTRR